MLNRLVEEKRVTVVAIMLLFIAMLLPGCGGVGSGSKSTNDKTISADVVVVGSGTCGLTAAIQAKQLGLNVMIIEKML